MDDGAAVVGGEGEEKRKQEVVELGGDTGGALVELRPGNTAGCERGADAG